MAMLVYQGVHLDTVWQSRLENDLTVAKREIMEV